MKCSNCENEEFTCVCGALVSADAPWREVVVDHRPGETCHVATSVDPATGWPRPLLDREEARVVAREAIAAEVNSWPDDAGLPYFPADLHTATTMQRLANPAVDAVMGLARPMPTREQIDALLQLWRVRGVTPEATASEIKNYRRRLRNALLDLLNGADE